MLITITVPSDDFHEAVTIQHNIKQADVKNVRRSDFDKITKVDKQGEFFYHITDGKYILPDLYYFINTPEGDYNLVNTCCNYDNVDNLEVWPPEPELVPNEEEVVAEVAAEEVPTE